MRIFEDPQGILILIVYYRILISPQGILIVPEPIYSMFLLYTHIYDEVEFMLSIVRD